MNKKILIITEAYSAQTNGVATTLHNTSDELEKLGYDVNMATPELFNTLPCPTYPEVRIVINPWKINEIFREENPAYVHIATEGPLAFYSMLYCRWNKIQFTTSYHTKLPEYIHKRFSFIPEGLIYWYLRQLHKHSKSVLVTTESMRIELNAKGFKNLVVWGRGVDREIFNNTSRICDKSNYSKSPVLLYVGRISIEKNIEAFLELDIAGAKKIIVGDGPSRATLQEKYPYEFWMGSKKGNELAWYYANADVFVFPSKTDTFGIVMIESSACGTPVAAFPVTGPKDYVKQGVTGYLDNDLKVAIEKCLKLSRTVCEDEAAQYTWEACTRTFVKYLTS